MIEGTIAKEKEDLEVHIEAARNLDAEVIEALLEGEQPKRELRGKNLSKAGHMVGAYVEGADVERRQDIQKLRSVQHDMLEEIAALEREEKEEERANMPCASFAGVDLLNLGSLLDAMSDTHAGRIRPPRPTASPAVSPASPTMSASSSTCSSPPSVPMSPIFQSSSSSSAKSDAFREFEDL